MENRENRYQEECNPIKDRDIPLEVLACSMRIRTQIILGIESGEDDPINQYLLEEESVDFPMIGRKLLMGISGIGQQIIPAEVSTDLNKAKEAFKETVEPSNEARIIEIVQGEVARKIEPPREKIDGYKYSPDLNSQIGLPARLTRGSMRY